MVVGTQKKKKKKKKKRKVPGYVCSFVEPDFLNKQKLVLLCRATHLCRRRVCLLEMGGCINRLYRPCDIQGKSFLGRTVSLLEYGLHARWSYSRRFSLFIVCLPAHVRRQPIASTSLVSSRNN